MATTVVLARLVAAEDFGLLAIAFVVINFATLLSGLGLGQALVQRKELRPEHVAVAFTLSVAVGLVLAGGTALSAIPAAAYFEEPGLRRILPVLALVFVCKGFEVTPNDMLVRSMRFREYYLTSTTALVVATAVGVVMAAAGHGVWALVALALVEASVASALAWVVAIWAGVWRPAFSFDRAALGDLLPYSTLVTASLFVGYGQANADNLIVGKVLGTRPLGYYNLAYRAMLLPLQRFGEVVNDTVFPALSAVKDDLPRLRAGFLRASQYVAVVFFPITIGLSVTAPQAVPVVFGPQWTPAVHALQILAASGPLLAMNRLRGALCLAIGKPSWDLWLNVFGCALFVPAFVLGSRHGIAGVALGFTLASVVEAPVVLVVMSRALATSVLELVRPLASVAWSTALMAAGAAGTGWLLQESVGPAVQLTAMVVVGGGLYVLCLRLLAPELVAGLVRDLARRVR